MPELAQMKLLINLARIDGSIADREKNYIINIGRANGIYPDMILPLFDQHHDVIIPKNITADEKFEYIFSLVQLMKIDERMYKEEIKYCSNVATKLGYHQDLMFELMLNVKSSSMSAAERDNLKKLAEKHLKK